MSRLARIARRPAQLLAIVAALGLGGVAVAATTSTHDDGELQIGNPADPLRVTVRSGLLFGSYNSKGGQPVISAAGMLPGASRFGEVKVANDGLLAGRYTLQATDLVNAPGPAGGRLGGRLLLRIHERSGTGTKQIFSGTVASLRSITLGRFASGEARIYRFTVDFPTQGSAADDLVQGATTRVTLRWNGTSSL